MTRSEVPWKTGNVNGYGEHEISRQRQQFGESSTGQHASKVDVDVDVDGRDSHSAKWFPLPFCPLENIYSYRNQQPRQCFWPRLSGPPSNNLATNARAQSNECTNQ